jgi:predicted transposase/invertase (TIGR01784 family)
MLMTEFNLDDALAVRYEDGFENGLQEGREEGEVIKALEIARNALGKGLSPEFVHEITGLDLEEIEKLQN